MSCSVVRIHNSHAKFDMLLYEIYATLDYSHIICPEQQDILGGSELIFLLARQTFQYHLDYRRLSISYHTGLMTHR